ncbi:LytTR family DNA-binding domain-containing protein [Companilactobacillus paralimentarius]|uniref:LytTR family DNA-binding domain-containing protein n=1 Tax=Companilactobacillus paralimentarius TaxID=83526 RepID=UPI00385018E6
MKIEINYQQKDDMPVDKAKVTVEAQSFSDDVQNLMKTIDNLDNHTDVVPLAVDDRVVMIQLDEIIAIEVYKNELTVYTQVKAYKLRGKLKEMYQRLNKGDFIQISKSAVINLNHLSSLEASFSGNMLAFMDNGEKLTVSRKYLTQLKESLGM